MARAAAALMHRTLDRTVDAGDQEEEAQKKEKKHLETPTLCECPAMMHRFPFSRNDF
jgi:hypothetical protein